MLRRLVLFSFLVAVSYPVVAQTCSLEMSVACQPGVHGATICTATTVNTGSASCSGLVYSAWYSQESHQTLFISSPQTSLPLATCIDSNEFGLYVDASFAFCFGEASIRPAQTVTSTVSITGASPTTPIVALTWVGDEEGNELGSAYAFTNLPVVSCTPTVSAPPVAQEGSEYRVIWTGVSDPTSQFIIEESTSPDFSSNVSSFQVQGLSRAFRHDNMDTTTIYYYRVRATNCGTGTPPFSRVAQTVVQASTPTTARNAEVTLPVGSTEPVLFTIALPPLSGKAAATTTFTAAMDKPFLGVNPKTGTYPPEGLTLTITARPDSLPVGANTGTLSVATNTENAGGVVTTAGTTFNIPVSISIVTPVAPGGKTTPPPNALIIPVVTHVNAAIGQFLSDVRLTNAGSTAITYQITLSPTQSDARTTSKVTQISVDPQQTVALNDIVKNFFGFGATSNPADVGFGSLEIRPLNTSSRLTFASSRTYANTITGTFGQFIAAMPFTQFAAQALGEAPIPGEEPSSVLSLQHISHSQKFRTNLGIVEGAGQPASGRIRVFNAAGTLLNEKAYSLLPGEHRQMNRYVEVEAGIPVLDNGRIEITVDSDTGAVSGYASVLDNITTDPLAVMPVDVTRISSTRYVVPGMAELPNRVDNFHSDLRIFNGAVTDAPIAMTFYPQGNGAPITAAPRTVRAGEMLVLDNVLPAYFNNATNTGGSIVITTTSPTSLVATGRTYTTMDNGGTFGQFIPGVTPGEGVGLGERGLQVLQLEQSSRFRSNLGLAELTGNPAEVRVSLIQPDTKVTPSINVQLAANEFRQLGRVIEGFLGPGVQVYNSRVTVEVVAGTGRVTAYGSVIDNESKDPTYVPAQ